MGVEWHIGCLKCKRQIWLGSQKPFKWKGFQIGDENIKRFLFLHSVCESKTNGNFLLTNDRTAKIPWESDNEKLEWQEDILSRSFCFDSWKENHIICANCSKKIKTDKEPTNENLIKSTFLWFCNESCFDNYIEYNRRKREYFIYDSTNDPIPLTIGDSFEVGCAKCKTFVIIDNQSNLLNKTKDFEYFALFLCEHIGFNHRLKINVDNKYSWRQLEDWIEYEY